MPHKLTLAIILLLVLVSAGWAEVTANLYETEITVENQSPEQRQQAIHHALEKVLEQVASAQATTLDDSILNKALTRAEHYVQQYRYTEQGLWVRFDDRLVNGLLQQGLDSNAITDEKIILKITGIHTLEDYSRIANYLNSLEFVHSTRPLTVAPDKIVFQIRAHGGHMAVAQSIAQNSFLQRKDGDEQTLSFHYSP